MPKDTYIFGIHLCLVFLSFMRTCVAHLCLGIFLSNALLTRLLQNSVLYLEGAFRDLEVTIILFLFFF
jgi:hypothetical protein